MSHEQTSRIRTKTVSCPYCGQETRLTVPDETVEPKARKSVAAFGEYTTTTCPQDHSFWVYFC